MSIEKVREYFKGFDMEDRILEFPVSSATVELAAQALGCEPNRIAKTLSFKVGEQCILNECCGTHMVTPFHLRFYQTGVVYLVKSAIIVLLKRK